MCRAICRSSSKKHKILDLRRGQSIFSISFIFVRCEEKDYYCVVSEDSMTAAHTAEAVAVCKAGILRCDLS